MIRPQLWRAAFAAPPTAMPGLLDALEPLAQSVSVFEAEADDEQRTTRWRVELILTENPVPRRLDRVVARACRPFGFAPGPVEVEAVPADGWLRAAAMPREPVRVGRFAVHGADHPPPLGLVPLQVEAGLAFGSGEHATTRACLLALGALAGRQVATALDLGCGSAVLGIAAAKLLRAKVLAVDNDPVAVAVAAENARINRVAGRVRAAPSEGYAAPAVRRAGPYDLILANILADPLIELAPATARQLAAGGTAVLSGFIARDAARVAAAHQARGLLPVRRIDVEAWSALVLRRPGPRRR
jgi:ribosomal protein L11 methyltransferase